MQTRPLTFFSFHLNYLANGASPWGFHMVNLFLHAGNSVLVLLIARTLVSPLRASLAAVLFAVHPLQTQAVNYVFERATLLAALFALLSLLLFLKERYGWAAAAFGISLLAKEETIALPCFLLIYCAIQNGKRAGWRSIAIMAGIAGLATTRLFYVLHLTPGAQLGLNTKGVSPFAYALTQCRVIWVYLRLFLFPAGLNLQHDMRLSTGLWAPPETLVGLFSLLLVLAVLGWLTWRHNVPALWVMGFFIVLAPSSSIVPVSDLIFEHRTYFPLAFLFLAIAVLLQPLPARLLVVTSVLLVPLLLAATIARNRVWHDELSLWTDVVEKSPHKALGYFHLGQAYAASNPDRARELYEQGLKLEPDSPVGHTNLGLVFMSQGNLDAALQHLQTALMFREDPLARNNLGVVELRLGQVEEGIRSFRRALQSDPCRFDARFNLIHALAYLEKQNEAEAAGRAPADCHFLPDQERKLAESLRALR